MPRPRTTLRLLAACLAAALCAPAHAWGLGAFFSAEDGPIGAREVHVFQVQDAQRTHVFVSVRYLGIPRPFGWLIPVPPGSDATASSDELMVALDRLTAAQFSLESAGEPCSVEPDAGTPPSVDAAPMPAADAAAEADAGEPVADAAMEPGREPPDERDPGREQPQTLSPEEIAEPLSIEVLGPAEDFATLQAWLDQWGFFVPADAPNRFLPYLAQGWAFVAIRAESLDPLGRTRTIRLSWPGAPEALPIRPTGASAEPDTRVLVHRAGLGRTVPTGFLLAEPNEVAIRWSAEGNNWSDVVAAMGEAAGGRAFVTDSAGLLPSLSGAVPPLDDALALQLTTVATLGDAVELFRGTTDLDVLRVLNRLLPLPPGVDARAFLADPDGFEWDPAQPYAGGPLASALQSEVNPERQLLSAALLEAPYVTRLHAALGPAAMTTDPGLAERVDRPEVPRQRTATLHQDCDTGREVVETPSGLRYERAEGQDPHAIRRENGATTAGAEVDPLALSESFEADGATMVVEDRRDALAMEWNARLPGEPPVNGGAGGAGGGGGRPGVRLDAGIPGVGPGTPGTGGSANAGAQVEVGDAEGCTCSRVGSSTGPGLWSLLLGALLALGRGRTSGQRRRGRR